VFQTDGNLVVYTAGKHALWGTMTKAGASAVLAMQDDGDLVVYTQLHGRALWSSADGLSKLSTGWLLQPGHVLYSPNHAYILAMQADGNLVAYHGRTWLWSSQTSGNPGAFATFQTDGNFVVYSRAGHPLWSSGTKAGPGSFLMMQDDGNLVIYAGAHGAALWNSTDALSKLNAGWLLPSRYILYSPNHAYMLVMQPDGNLVLYNSAKRALWSSRTSSPGAFALFQTDGNFVVYSRAGHPLWSSGTKAGPQSFLMVQNDGNVVVYATPQGPGLWSTRT
jgi:phosphoribosyl-AMP cyclohydrolase